MKLEDYKALGYDEVECSKCKKKCLRKSYGKSPNGKRVYYLDDKNKAWRGKKCPECSKASHTDYMKSYRKHLIETEDEGLKDGDI